MGEDRAAAELARILGQTAPQTEVPNVDAYGIYGAGDLGQLCFDLLQQLGKRVVGVWDQDESRAAAFSEINGVALYEPGGSRSTVHPLIICVAKAPFAEVRGALESKGFSNLIGFYDFAEAFAQQTGFNNGWRLDDVSQGESAALFDLFEHLDDDVSRVHLCEFLHWHRHRTPGRDTSFDPDIENLYFPEFIQRILNDDETFVDIGAHTGRVIARFHDLRAGAYRRIIGIEPDPHNLGVAAIAVGTLDPRIQLVAAGIGATDRLTPYAIGKNYLSAPAGDGQFMVAEYRIDSLGLAPTIMKVHTEGSELTVLASAANTIAASRPIVAVTAYHERCNVGEIGDFIVNRLEDYHCHFRCHSHVGTSAVLYGVPAERAE